LPDNVLPASRQQDFRPGYERNSPNTTLILFVLDDANGAEDSLATVIVDPGSVFVSVSEATETFALDVDRNCERRVFFGFIHTRFCVVSHEELYARTRGHGN
jgi:hypothetical protein